MTGDGKKHVGGLTLECTTGTTLVMHIEWPSRAAAGDYGVLPTRPVTNVDCLAADIASAGRGWAEIGDVILDSRTVPADVANGRLVGMVGRYPGCAIAAVSMDNGQCLVADRAGETVGVGVHGADGGAGLEALAAGVFMHAWLCAGQSPGSLAAAELRLRMHSPRMRGAGLVQGSVLSCSFTASGASALAGEVASRSLTWAASGAPSSV